MVSNLFNVVSKYIYEKQTLLYNIKRAVQTAKPSELAGAGTSGEDSGTKTKNMWDVLLHTKTSRAQLDPSNLQNSFCT